MAISLLPLAFPSVCLGIYLQDVDNVNLWAPSREPEQTSIISIDDVSDNFLQNQDLLSDMRNMWHVELKLVGVGATGLDADVHDVIFGCRSGWTMRSFSKNVSAAFERSTSTAKIVNAERIQKSQPALETGKSQKSSVTSSEMLTPIPSSSRRASLSSSLSEGLRPVLGQEHWGYRRTLQEYTQHNAAMNVMTHEVNPKEVAAKITYHFWSPERLTRTIMRREHMIPKLFKRVPVLTRQERYAIFCSGLQTAFFWSTFLFRADCQMVPKPSVCGSSKKSYWYSAFIPSWGTFFASLFGLFCAVPVPFILQMLFRKTPVLEKLSDKEKTTRLRSWRAFTIIGWIVVTALHTFYIYWLTIFSNHFHWSVFEKWVNSSMMSLLHRFVTAPGIRGAVFLLLLFLSRLFSFADYVFLFMPHIVPLDQLQFTAIPRESGLVQASTGTAANGMFMQDGAAQDIGMADDDGGMEDMDDADFGAD